jgi:hypothetical protein
LLEEALPALLNDLLDTEQETVLGATGRREAVMRGRQLGLR